MASRIRAYNHSFRLSLRNDSAAVGTLTEHDLLLAHLHASKINHRPTSWAVAALATDDCAK